MGGMGRVLTLVAAFLALTGPFFITSADFLRIDGFDRLIDATVDDVARSQVLMGLVAALVILTIGVMLAGRAPFNRQKSAGTATLNQQYAEAVALVRDVTSEPDVSVLVVDGQGKILFANAAAASRGGKSESELIDRSITALFGAAESERMLKFISQALDERATIRDRRTVKSSKTNNLRMFVTRFYPLAADGDGRERVLLVDRDISEAALERERRRRSLDRLTDLLMKVASRLDSRTMTQAARISELAGLLALKLELAPERVEAVKTAGKLLGLGRFFAANQPTDSPADRIRRRQEATTILAENLKGIDFEGPVVETIRQMHERWDGKGPSRRSGITIEPTARILSVSAAFLSMVSTRSDQESRATIEQAAQSLMDGADKLYERQVVRALIQHLDEGGRKIWEEAQSNPEVPISPLTPNLNPHRDAVILSDAPAAPENPAVSAPADKPPAPGKPQGFSVKQPEINPEKKQKISAGAEKKSTPEKNAPPSTDKSAVRSLSSGLAATDAKKAGEKSKAPELAKDPKTAPAPATKTGSSAAVSAPPKPPIIHIHRTPTASKKETA